MNSVHMMGRLTRDPEMRYTAQQIAVCTFTLAVPRKKQKDREQETDFFPVIVWRARAEFAKKYLRKGQRVAVTGELQTRTYEDKSGNKRSATEIIAENIYFADSKAAESSTDNSNHYDYGEDTSYPSSDLF